MSLNRKEIMKTNVNKEVYVIYNDIKANLHVAIKKDLVTQIQAVVREYHQSENIPEDEKHSIKGVYLQNTSENEYNMIDENETDVLIKYLRFDNL